MTISTTVHSMGRYQGKMVPGLTSRDTPFRWISATHCPRPGGGRGAERGRVYPKCRLRPCNIEGLVTGLSIQRDAGIIPNIHRPAVSLQGNRNLICCFFSMEPYGHGTA